MTFTDDHHDHAAGGQRPARRSGPKRRTPIVIGAAGLATVLGGGAYVITDHFTEHRTEAANVGVQAPPVVFASASASASASATAASAPRASASASTAAPQEPASPSLSPSQSIAPEVRKMIDEARERMAQDGVGVKHPLPGPAMEAVDGVKMTTQGSLNSGGIVRMVTARGDLTGQRELAWVSGGVKKYRDVPCSQTIRVSPDSPPARKANLLICWRTSAKKSVISIVVDPKGHPSRDKAVDALEKKWRSMG